MRNFELDYRLLMPPQVEPYYIELLGRGEVSNMGIGYTDVSLALWKSVRDTNFFCTHFAFYF